MAALIAKALAIAVFIHAPCPGETRDLRFGSACAMAPQTVYAYGQVTHTDYMHELGHIYDYNFLTDQQRGTFLYLIHEKRWWLAPAPNSPHEKFAVAFSFCARNPDRLMGHAAGDFGYFPSRRTHRRVCRWMATL